MIIIRCYKKDEFAALKCYESMVRVGLNDKFYFHYDNELGQPTLINQTGVEIINREPCGNFGGLLFVKRMMDDLKKIPKPNEEEFVIYSDADVEFNLNPFDFIDSTIDHAGYYGDAHVKEGIPHVSGQCNIIKGWLWNKYIAEGEEAIDRCFDILQGSEAGCADDTLFSIYSHINNAKQKSFYNTNCWVHPVNK